MGQTGCPRGKAGAMKRTMTALANHPRIAQDPTIMGGKPCIAGTRIPVDLLLRKLAAGETREQLLGDYAGLVAADLDAALNYAAALAAGERLVAAE
jgi:uncharacterized protein (DUF433 family)